MVTPSRRGYTVTELMLVVAILGILGTAGAQLLINVNRFFMMTTAKAELQREARAAMYLINRSLRQARSTTITVDRASTSQPFYSRITFTTIQGTTIRYYQNGNQLVRLIGNNSKVLTKNVRYLSFHFPRSDDLTIVSVSLTLEKSTYEGKKKALQMASEKVRVMN